MSRLIFVFYIIAFSLPSCLSAQEVSVTDEGESYSTKNVNNELLAAADLNYQERHFKRAVKSYKILLENKGVDKKDILKKISLSYAALHYPKETEVYIKEYFLEEFDISFLANVGFDGIRDSEEFKGIVSTYTPKFSAWWFLFLYITLIGIFIAVVLNFNKKIDKIAGFLISSLILTHSLFILHICIFGANYQYVYPNALLISTFTALLYGPLLYFYFKRTILKHVFKPIDLLHLLPTLLLFAYLIPIYILPSKAKLNLLMNGNVMGFDLLTPIGMLLLILAKLISLTIYGYFIWKIYFLQNQDIGLRQENKNWQRNIYRIHLAYIATYIIYALLTANGQTFGFLYHLQLFCMSAMVLFLGYYAYIQPDIFNGVYFKGNRLFAKYESSALTKSLSEELKHGLIHLFEEKKIYQENDLTLTTLAEHLGTSLHSTSQVINEHFNMNFNELVNNYRIQEAKELLISNEGNELNIIDIVYKVGFNNKVSFSRAFKKHTNSTPSQYKKFLQDNFSKL